METNERIEKAVRLARLLADEAEEDLDYFLAHEGIWPVDWKSHEDETNADEWADNSARAFVEGPFGGPR